MLSKALVSLQKIPKTNIVNFSNIIRNYSRRIASTEGPYKIVKAQRTKDASNLVWRDPSFELLASSGFPLFLRGNVGLAWYDTHTTIKTNHELIMEQIDDTGDDLNGDMVLRVQTCPTVLRQTVCDLFPYRPLENSEISVITITLKPNFKQMRQNKELETERMAQAFVLASKAICIKLRNNGYWADFVNPFSGRPYLVPSSGNELYKTDEKFRCLDFQIFEIKDCKVISNEDTSKKRFIGSLFMNAPCKKDHLNNIFKQKLED